MEVRLLLAVACLVAAVECGTFTIENDSFMKDGKPFQIRSGCIHYSRVHPDYWKDRLQRLAAMGLNAIETYVPWNFHEETQGNFSFTGWADLPKFLKTAQEVGLVVMLRAGPYMCGEWEFGGFPAWLLGQHPPVTIRTYEPGYIALVDKWWGQLLTQVKPLIYQNGGPVVMMQVENEYGSYGNVGSNPNDRKYIEHLISLGRQHLGPDIVLYTTDGGNTGYLSRGTLKGDAVYSVVDFGPGNPSGPFAAQKEYNSPGKSPKLCSEFYSGWLTHWGEHMANTSSANLGHWLDVLLGDGGSVSLYMGHGGSNFGFWSGANGGGKSYSPHITSYDYDSPISEGGEHGYGSDHADKFNAVKAAIAKHASNIPAELPFIPSKAYGAIPLTESAGFFASLSHLSGKPVDGVPGFHNATMEQFGQNYGFIMYSAAAVKLPSGGTTLTFTGLGDRVQVYLGGSLQGTDYRPEAKGVKVGAGGQRLDLLVENMGRLNYGRGMTDPKGLQGVNAGGKSIESLGNTNWTVHNIPLFPGSVQSLPFAAGGVHKATAGPVFHRGHFTITGNPEDTYFSTAGWDKGIMWVNGFNLGRYWDSRGPQHTLYVPAPVLKSGSNELIILEVDTQPASPSITSVAVADFHTGSKTCGLDNHPAAGDEVVMYGCSGSSAAQQFQLTTSGTITIGGSTMCMTVAGKDPSTGSPSVEVQSCTSGNKAQVFHTGTGGSIVHTATGHCLDITAHNTNNGARVEVYSCNGGSNQQWTIDPATQHITSKQDGHCLSACKAPPRLYERV